MLLARLTICPVMISSLDEKIVLKVGVPVMILVNLDLENGISNGSQGIVTSVLTIAVLLTCRIWSLSTGVRAVTTQQLAKHRVRLCLLRLNARLMIISTTSDL